MPRRAANPKVPFMARYRHAEDGRTGSPSEWRAAFKFRLGVDAATEEVKNSKRTPRSILGVSRMALWDEIKSAYRKLVKQLHPDLGGDPAAFRTVQAAYEVLEDANARGRLASTE